MSGAAKTRLHSNRLEFLTHNDWTLINARATRVKFRLGEEIIRQGSPGTAIYIIRKGTASVQLSGTKERVTVATLGPDEICGDMAFLERGMSTASVVASDEEVEADVIQAMELRQLFEAFGGLGTRFYCSLAVVLARRLRDTSAELAHEVNLRGL